MNPNKSNLHLQENKPAPQELPGNSEETLEEVQSELTGIFMEESGMLGLINQANHNSQQKGFWDDFDQIIKKMQHPSVNPGMFTDWDVEAVKKAFKTQKIMLMVSELSEAMEALRAEDPDDPIGEELADALIRIFDFAGKFGINLPKEVLDKMKRNRQRPHKHNKSF